MESMRRSEANSSHHPNKVAVNSLATESNKQSSGSGSTLNNNNKLSYNQQQKLQQKLTATTHQQQHKDKQQKTNIVGTAAVVTNSNISSNTASSAATTTTTPTSSSSSSGASSTSSESKDTNFEYDDNEWDVGGIGDLIIDLDADIEKSSSIAGGGATTVPTVAVVGAEATPTTSVPTGQISNLVRSLGNNSSSTTTTKTSTSTKKNQISILNTNEKSSSGSSASSSSSSNNSSSSSSSPTTVSSSKSSSLSSTALFSPITKALNQVCSNKNQTTAKASSAVPSAAPIAIKPTATKQIKAVQQQQSLKLQQPSLVAQLTGKTTAGTTVNSTESRFNLISGSSNKIGHNNNNNNSTGAKVSTVSPILSGSLVVGQQQQVVTVGGNQTTVSSSMSSQPSGGQGAGKSATKMSIDHQATLDKGLKMKIKRTKPGTKTSEAKHEIVKAEQNGTSSNSLDDTNNSSNLSTGTTTNSSTGSGSGSGKNKHNQQANQQTPTVQSLTAQTITNVPTTTTTPTATTKRGSSGHRRDKTRDKTPHSRDKSEHNSNSSTGSGGSSNSNNSTSSSHSNSTNSNDRSTTTTTNNSNSSGSSGNSCNCVHEVNGSGIQTTCTNVSCIRNRTTNNNSSGGGIVTGNLEQQSNNNSITQRISGAAGNNVQNSNNSSVSSNLTGNSGGNGNMSTAGIFNNNGLIGGNNQTSNNSNNANAPGPPIKDGKMNLTVGSSVNNHQQHQSSTQIPNPNSTSLTAATQQQQPTVGLSPAIGSSGSTNSQISSNSSKLIPSGLISATVHHTISVAANNQTGTSINTGSHNCDDGTLSPPAAKRIKTDSKDMVDICVGTSVGTITEPDCLGPCEPGTSVTLEGIVWHETEGGVLVVNVTWRGKTYVGTLLDCTRHDWAPPRFCDSPTEELDSRTPKGRGKRGRSANLTPDLSNFTETRSSVHSKLRNGGAKGRGGRGVTTGNTTATTTTPSTTTTAAIISGNNGNGTTTTTASSGSVTSTPTSVSTSVSASIVGNMTSSSNTSNSNNTPSTSPTAFLPPRPEKRKSKDESPSPVNGDSDIISNNNGNSIIPATTQSTQIIVNPITGLNVQISNKKCKTASPCAISPVLLECPEQDCNKKYKHANGLRYHQSHAHGSGSMDEDSSTMPESPVRVVPPTTPSPNPPNTPQPIQVAQSTASTTTTTTTPTPTIGSSGNTNNNNIPTNVTGSNNGGITGNGPSPIMTTVSSPTSGNVVNVPGGGITSGQSPVVSVSSSGAGLLSSASVIPSNLSTPLITPIPVNVQSQPPQTAQIPQHTIAGGSITAGISGQALSQHQQQQQHSMLVGTVPNQGILSGGNNQMIPEAGGQQQQQSNMPVQQQQPPINVHSNLLTPTRGDGPIKPGVLRFGPAPPIDITGGGNPNLLSTQQSPLRPTPTGTMAPNSGPTSTPETAHQPSYGQSQTASQQGIPVNKSQNYGGKQKKNRKSPVEFDNSTSRDDVQSPAYSDISDDSTPVVEADLTDKTQSVKHPDVVKKPQEGPPPQIPQLGGYGMYQFYAQQPYMVPPPSDHPGSGLVVSGPKQTQSQQQQQQSMPSGLSNDPYNKNKEPPLDLMTKPPSSQQSNDQQQQLQQQNNGKDLGPGGPSTGPPINLGPQNPTKPMPHFYPFNYMPPGYPYNVDPNYGPVSMVSDDNKIGGPGQNLPPPLKDDRNKESQSPHGNLDHGKITGQSPQIIPTKLIKNEPQLLKDIKQEPNNSHSMHPKDSPVQSLGGYPGLYQRHPLLSVPQQPTPQHLSREDELRRYYIYPDQRRSNAPNNSSSLGNKDEPPSSLMHHQQQQQQQQQQSQISQQIQQQSPQSQQQSNSQKSSKSGSQSSKATNLIKDIKDEKDIKIKQEGQKPTMETQGPPPPPTSQYFLHPSYISPGPFGFDPTTHPMYRNVLMSAGPYNPPPYHLSMARFHAPEDLSRNPGTKALDALHHAAQYYNTTQHKIHELAERAMKSPTSNNNNSGGGGGVGGNNSGGSKTVNVSSPNISQQPGNNNGPNGPNNGPGGPNSGPGGPPNLMTSSSGPGGPLNLQPPPGSLGSMSGPGGPLGGSGGGGGGINSSQKGSDVSGKSGSDPSGKGGPIGVGGIGGGPPGSVGAPGGLGPAGGVGPGGVGGPGGPDSRSPPPQRHVHTHHHTHVGLGYPMYPAPYVSNVSAAVLASQQAAAVAVINPFPPGPTK